jgi:hypothetical protein
MNAAAEFGHRVVRGQGHQYADASHPLRLLRACREWPNDRRTSNSSDEVASPHCLPKTQDCADIG